MIHGIVSLIPTQETAIPSPSKCLSKVSKKIQLNSRVMLIELELINPATIEFLPGQFVNIKVNDKNFRSYSICSLNQQNKSIQIIVAVGHDGLGSNYAKSLKIGDTVEFVGPSGRFYVDKISGKELIFIATGTGISPIFSMLEFFAVKKCDSKITLLFGVRDETELILLDKIKSFRKFLPNFEYKICFSQHIPDNFENSVSGRVTQHIPNNLDAQYFLCGNPDMIQEVIQILTARGIKETQIFHEKFTVTP